MSRVGPKTAIASVALAGALLLVLVASPVGLGPPSGLGRPGADGGGAGLTVAASPGTAPTAPSSAGAPDASVPGALPLPSGVSNEPAVGAAASPGTTPPAGATGDVNARGPAAVKAADYRAPALRLPLANLDPSLAHRGPRPSLSGLALYQYETPAVIVDPLAAPSSWQLRRPSQAAVRGYAGDVSVPPGGVLPLHIVGRDATARLDIFRMGLRDGQLVATVPRVPVGRGLESAPDRLTGLVQEHWPVTWRLRIGADWQSGVYLVKMTGSSGGQSYILFVVRPVQTPRLLVVLPTMTYQAYNEYGGSDLYGWSGGPRNRAYMVSFDRPFAAESGAGLFFRLDFPLIVWLEDHGYTPGYVTDVDLARTPSLLDGTTTVVFSGHGEYWTGSMRDSVDAAARSGVNLAFFGANQAFWQVRLGTDPAGSPDRTVICYKSASADPVAHTTPSAATVRFQDKPVLRPSESMIGEAYGGIHFAISPMVVGPGINTFAPRVGLRPGERLPGLVAPEIDTPGRSFSGILLGATPVGVSEHGGSVTAGFSLWVSPAGNRVFDAGTFDYSWGLDPRYAAALPGFPAQSFSDLTALVLAWLGARPG